MLRRAMNGPDTHAAPTRSTLVAWSVHLLTATGAVMGVRALVAIGAGEFSAAAIWILAALAVDSVDGTLARAVRVKEVLPNIDGRRLDDMVDFLNYVIVALVFMAAAGQLWSVWWAAIPALASAYGFSQTNAKTEDGFFLGFPSYWNVIAIYAWLFDVSAQTGTLVVLGFSVLVFVPLKYVYPSKSPVFKRSTVTGSGVWIIVLALACLRPETSASHALTWISLLFPAWYFGVSLVYGGLHRPGKPVR
jgi:phosphatidylcholine synthase